MALPITRGQAGIIFHYGVCTHEDSLFFRAHFMNALTGIFAGDPDGTRRIMFGRSDKFVCGLCPFQENIRSFFGMKSKKTFVEQVTFIFQDTGYYLTACRLQFFNAPAGNLWERVGFL